MHTRGPNSFAGKKSLSFAVRMQTMRGPLISGGAADDDDDIDDVDDVDDRV